MTEYWEITEGKVDSTLFFILLYKYFSDATSLYIEGTSIYKDAINCFQRHRDEGEFLPGRQTLFPHSNCFRCQFTEPLVKELSGLSLSLSEPELMDHLAIYKGGDAIIEWHDAFANAMLVSKSIPENIVASFSEELGLSYCEAKFN